MAAPSLSLVQHKEDFHSRCAAGSLSGNYWKARSQPAAEKKQTKKHILVRIFFPTTNAHSKNKITLLKQLTSAHNTEFNGNQI